MTCGCHIHHTNKCGNAPTGMAALSDSGLPQKKKDLRVMPWKMAVHEGPTSQLSTHHTDG